MMTRLEERRLRSLLLNGGRLTLPGATGPLFLTCKRHGELCSVTLHHGRALPRAHYYWHPRDLYPLLAERLDELTTRLPRPHEPAALAPRGAASKAPEVCHV